MEQKIILPPTISVKIMWRLKDYIEDSWHFTIDIADDEKNFIITVSDDNPDAEDFYDDLKEVVEIISKHKHPIVAEIQIQDCNTDAIFIYKIFGKEIEVIERPKPGMNLVCPHCSKPFTT